MEIHRSFAVKRVGHHLHFARVALIIIYTGSHRHSEDGVRKINPFRPSSGVVIYFDITQRGIIMIQVLAGKGQGDGILSHHCHKSHHCYGNKNKPFYHNIICLVFIEIEYLSHSLSDEYKVQK